MSRLCNIHPGTPALWECKQCNIAWCKECIETNTIQAYGIGSGHRAQYYCPSCSRPVRAVARGRKKKSAWADVLACFSQPLQMQSLLVMLPLSIVTAILASVGLNPLFFPLLWFALLPLIVIGFQKAAAGAFSSPKLTKDDLLGSIPDVLKHFVLFATVFTAFMQVFTQVGIFAAMMFACLAMAVLPAVITVLLLSGRMRSCLNPGIIFATATALGEAYAILAVFLPIFLIAMLWVGSWLGNVVPVKIEMFFLSLVVNYFTFVCYLLVGYIIHHSQKELAAVPTFKKYFAQDEEDAGIDAPRNECIHIVDQLIAEDRVSDALDYLENKTTETVLDTQLAQRYYDLLRANHDGKRLLEHAKLYLDLLASEDKEEELCTIYMDCQFEDPRFAPSPPTLFKIARLLNKRGQSREAVGAFYQFATVYRQSTYAPKALFLAATILNEQLNEPEKCVSVLKDLVNSYPSYPMTREARGYLKAAMKKVRRIHTKHDAPVYELRAVK